MPDTFTIHEVEAGVWAAVAPDTAGPAVSNAAIVDLGEKTLVVDTFMTVRAATELAGEAKRLTGRAPHVVVNSHWHSDHVRGNGVFAGLAIVGTSRMNELIVADAPKTPGEFQGRLAEIERFAELLAARAGTESEKARAAGTRALADALAEEAGSFAVTLPNLLVTGSLVVEDERSAVIAGSGKGHTESDLFVHLPDTGTVITGDLVWTGVHPKTSDGFPAEWAAVADRIAALSPRVIVPGHGLPGTSADADTMAGYLRRLAELVDAVRSGEVPADSAQPPPGSEDWKDIDRFRKGLEQLAATPAPDDPPDAKAAG